jgi:hypothetical protein
VLLDPIGLGARDEQHLGRAVEGVLECVRQVVVGMPDLDAEVGGLLRGARRSDDLPGRDPLDQLLDHQSTKMPTRSSHHDHDCSLSIGEYFLSESAFAQ